MADSYYTRRELEALSFAALGADVHISRKASIYAPEKMRIGSHVRVDDFAFLVDALLADKPLPSEPQAESRYFSLADMEAGKEILATDTEKQIERKATRRSAKSSSATATSASTRPRARSSSAGTMRRWTSSARRGREAGACAFEKTVKKNRHPARIT